MYTILPKGLNIAQMQLAPNARRGAEWVLARYPHIVFTSGRRDVLDQARVMAQNTLRYGRGWIRATYRHSPMIDTLCGWLADHPEAATVPVMAHGFYECLLACHSGELTRFSRHLTGDAFDAAWPGDEAGEKMAADIRATMPADYGLHRVIDREGGLRVLHVQFAPSVDV